MANTTNLDLIKPDGTDRALVSQINSNSEKIDLFAGKMIDEAVYYGTSTTAAGTQQKDVTVTNFPSSLKSGQKLTVKFLNRQSYNGQPTLKVNNLAVKNICRYGSTAAARYEWQDSEVVNFIYDGTNWIIVGGGIAGTTYYGKTKLTSALNSTSETLALTAYAGKALNDKFSWKFLAYQDRLDGGDAVQYPADAVELYIENGGQYAQFVHIPIAGYGTYYYGGDYNGNGIAVHIDRTNRKAWVYAGKQSGSPLSTADSRVYYR